MEKEFLMKSGLLRCPACVKTGNGNLIFEEIYAKCKECSSTYPFSKELINMMPSNTCDNRQEDIKSFWDADFKRRFVEAGFEKEKIYELLGNFKEGLEDKEHILVKELELKELQGKNVLEIGSGSGAHASLMRSYGAHLFAMDIAKDRVIATAEKLSLVKEGRGIAVHADAQMLPFGDNSFDIVYSSGVLHHAPDTNACVKEVYRVLKPGGKAIIMLYARWALSTWLYIYPKGILSGLIFKYPEEKWMGYVTEGGPIEQKISNPFTRVYSKKQIKELFSDFKEIRVRQSSFRFFDIPRIGKYIYKFLKKLHNLREFEGGKLASGIAWKQLTPIEKMLGRRFGNCLNILATK